MAKERWRWVPGYEGRYEVSDRGRVRSYMRPGGRYVRQRVAQKAQRYLAGWLDPLGYRKVELADPGGGRTLRGIHQLVMAAFVGPCPEGKEINHKNGQPGDNRLENLEYCTHGENIQHAWDTGLRVTRTGLAGEENPFSKLTAAQVREIRRLYAAGDIAQAPLGRKFGIGQGHVGRIVRRELWAHI